MALTFRSPSPPLALALTVGLVVQLTACGARPPPFSAPQGGAPADRAAECRAHLTVDARDEAAHACYREAMARLGRLEAAVAFLARLPDAAAFTGAAERLLDPAAALERARPCAAQPRCALVLAESHWALGAPEPARAALAIARRGPPAVEAAAARLAVEFDLADGAFAAAREAAGRAQRVAPESADAHWARARLALAAGELAAASSALDAARARRPDAPQLDLLEAAVAAARGDREGQIAALRAGLAAAPGAHRARATLASALAAAGRPAAAVEHLDLLLAARPEDPELMLALGRALLETGASARALAWAERILEADPRTPGARLLQAEALLGQRAVEAALALRPRLYTGPHALDHRLRLAQALADGGYAGRAEAEVAAAVAEHPREAAAWLAYARWQADAGHVARAAGLIEEGLRAQPGAADLHAALGALRERLDDAKGARAAFERAATLAPDQPEHADEVARLMHAAGEVDAAIQRWASILAQHTEAHRARLRLARAERALGRGEACLDHARRLTDQRPSDAAAWGIRAECELLSGSKPDAVNALERAVTLGADASRYLPLLATALADLGRDDEAEARFRQSLRSHPENRALRFVFGHYLNRQGRTAEAIATYQQLLARDPTDRDARAALTALGAQPGAATMWPAAQADPDLAALAQRAPPPSDTQGAVVLRDERTVTVDARGVAQVRHVRSILVQRATAIRRSSEASVSFHASHPAQVVRARTLTPDGQEQPVGDAGQLVRDPHAGTPLYGDARTLVLQFPQVEPGAIIDYEVITARPHPDLESVWWDGYILANVDPTLRARYTLALPSGAEVAVRAPGMPAPTDVDADGRRTLSWEATDIPAHDLGRAEVGDVPAVYVSSLRTWSEVDAWYHTLFAGRSRPDAAVRARARALVGDAADRRQQIAQIYRFVERRIDYLGIEFGLGAYQPRPAASTLAAGKGDCKDMTALMVALLAALDIEAYPALVRPRAQGPFIDGHPSPGQFSHVVLYVPGARRRDDLWLDATAGLATLDAIPAVLRDRQAFVVDGRGGRLVRISAGDEADHRLVTASRYRLTRTGGGELASRTTATGDLAGVVRRALLPLDAAGRRALLAAPGYLLGKGTAKNATVEAEGLEDAARGVAFATRHADADLVGVRLDGALVLGIDMAFLGDGPVPALASERTIGAPRVFERRVRIEPPPGYRFDWPTLAFRSRDARVRLTVEERRRLTETEIIVRLHLPGGRLRPADRMDLLLALRGARETLAPALRVIPGPQFDRVGFLRALVEERPGDPQLRMHLGRALLAAEQPGDAAAAFAAARSLGLEDREVLGLMALALMRADDAGRAAEALELLARRDDAQPASHLMLAAALREAGRPEDATVALRRGLAQHPADRRLSVELVRALGQTGDVQAALAAAEAHAGRHPEDPDAFNLVADAAAQAGDAARAEAAYRRSLAQRPAQPRALNNLAWLLRDRAAARPEAIALIRRAIKLDATADTQWDTLAELLSRQGDRRGALKALDRAQRLNPAKAAFYAQRRAALSAP